MGKQVIKRRFESYNKVWLANTQYEMSGAGAGGGGMMGYGDGNDRLLSAHEQEYGVMSSMEYLNDKVTISQRPQGGGHMAFIFFSFVRIMSYVVCCRSTTR